MATSKKKLPAKKTRTDHMVTAIIEELESMDSRIVELEANVKLLKELHTSNDVPSEARRVHRRRA